jgi:predicted transcriptional regulator
MCQILLSIKPEYNKKIMCGDKKFEFRRRIPTRRVDKILIYSTAPEMKVIGEVDVCETVELTIVELWNKTKNNAGISEKDFFKYFETKEKGYAYVLGNVEVYTTPIPLIEMGIKFPAQSFIYMDDFDYTKYKNQLV